MKNGKLVSPRTHEGCGNRVARGNRHGIAFGDARAGARSVVLRYIPSEGSHRELCGWVRSAHKAENSAVTGARFVDTQGQLLLECGS